MNREEAFEHGVKEFCKQAQYSGEETQLMTKLALEASISALSGGAIGGLAGASGGGALGAGIGGLVHFLGASEEKRKLKDYLRTMLRSGTVGALLGGTAGAGLGAMAGHSLGPIKGESGGIPFTQQD